MRSSMMAIFAGVLTVFTASVMVAGMWRPQTLVVHEWGVNYYDWAKGVAVAQKMPDFIYTDKAPGRSVRVPALRVKDMPPDSGVRTKPVLYFHAEGYSNRAVPVAVEVRFAYGNANAWWPQVNVYRTPDQVADAKAVDWDAWRKQQEKERMTRRPPKIPDDKRFELSWHHLTLSKSLPKGVTLSGADLPDNHWVKVARQVDSHYVSNGKEVEKYLFYEGTTTRTPVVTVLAPEGRGKTHHVVNVGDHPIYDVFAVYRDGKRGQIWTRYLAVMPPVPRIPKKAFTWGHEVPQIVSLPLLDSDIMPAGDPVSKKKFATRTTERLVEALTSGQHLAFGCRGMRDPADHQPSTVTHQLYHDEAVALEAIWHEDFFEAEGLTIIYRESPAHLDEAMPLHIYTDMFHYVKLSRCGLVLNRNVNYRAAKAVADAVRSFGPNAGAKTKAKSLATCRRNRFLALGLVEFHRRMGYGHTQGEELGAGLLQELKK